jgi:hypothetical protein
MFYLILPFFSYTTNYRYGVVDPAVPVHNFRFVLDAPISVPSIAYIMQENITPLGLVAAPIPQWLWRLHSAAVARLWCVAQAVNENANYQLLLITITHGSRSACPLHIFLLLCRLAGSHFNQTKKNQASRRHSSHKKKLGLRYILTYIIIEGSRPKSRCFSALSMHCAYQQTSSYVHIYMFLFIYGLFSWCFPLGIVNTQN